MKHTTLQKVEERDKKKMETLKRKLHTDDESMFFRHIFLYEFCCTLVCEFVLSSISVSLPLLFLISKLAWT